MYISFLLLVKKETFDISVLQTGFQRRNEPWLTKDADLSREEGWAARTVFVTRKYRVVVLFTLGARW